MKTNLIKMAFFGLIVVGISSSGFFGIRIAGADEVDEELSSTIKSDPEYRGKKPPAESAPAAQTTPPPAATPPAKSEGGNHDEKEWKTMHSESKSDKPAKKKSEPVKIDMESHRIDTPKISFNSNSATPTANSKSVIMRVGDLLMKNPNLSVRIEGHTDSIGYDQPNLELSQKRADQVKEILVQAGVSADRVLSVGMGDRYPITSSMTPQGQEKNRRVEFHIVETEAAQPMMPSEEQAPPPPSPVFPVTPPPTAPNMAPAPAPTMMSPPPPAPAMMPPPPAPAVTAPPPAAPMMAPPQTPPAQMMAPPPTVPAAPMVNTPPSPAPAAPSPMMPPPPPPPSPAPPTP